MGTKFLIVFGTRPEAVKMCPLVAELKTRPGAQVVLCVTGQHRQMLDEVLTAFHMTPDYDLDIMGPEQDLETVTTACITGLSPILAQESPDMVLVHGDTTTAFAAALTAFYHKVPIAHIEAGLRTYDLTAPFPEEFDRQAIDILSRYLFAPTERARQNLLEEKIPDDRIWVTGNTGLDALPMTVREDFTHPILDWCGTDRLVLLTAHRRENLGAPMEQIFRAVRRMVDDWPDVRVVYPVHPNPQVRKTARAILSGHERILLTEPLGVVDLHNLLARCHFIMTDSGGIQEEACALHRPALVLRDKTERPEGIEAGGLMLVGTDESSVYAGCRALLEDAGLYDQMVRAVDPFGDGSACRRIADILLSQR